MTNKTAIILLAVVLAIAGIAYNFLLLPDAAKPTVVVRVPTLTADAKRGVTIFDNNCAVCHGKNAAGTDQGPPLVHKIYEPDHHADFSFQRAAKVGVRAHHWPYGNMAPVPGVSEDEVRLVITYVRELQRANGIQ